jgi:uncharacterized FlaG/YvyC family protein
METNAVDPLGPAGRKSPADKPSANPRPSNTPEQGKANSGEDLVTLSNASRAAASAQKPQNSGEEEIRRQKSSSNNENQSSPSNLRRLTITDNQQVVLKIIDPSTQSVIKQLPTEELIRLREAVRSANESSVQILETE